MSNLQKLNKVLKPAIKNQIAKCKKEHTDKVYIYHTPTWMDKNNTEQVVCLTCVKLLNKGQVNILTGELI